MGEHGPGDCEKAVHAVYEYLDGEMEATERVLVTEHLRRCRGCADAVEFERVFLTKIRKACPEEPPPTLIEKVRALLHESDVDRR